MGNLIREKIRKINWGTKQAQVFPEKNHRFDTLGRRNERKITQKSHAPFRDMADSKDIYWLRSLLGITFWYRHPKLSSQLSKWQTIPIALK